MEEFLMPHYRDGTPANVGDIVRGRGYNIKHEIIGKVIAISEASSCNLQVACVARASTTWKHEYGIRVDTIFEYGECAAFEKVYEVD
jgi:hypothetical protein